MRTGGREGRTREDVARRPGPGAEEHERHGGRHARKGGREQPEGEKETGRAGGEDTGRGRTRSGARC